MSGMERMFEKMLGVSIPDIKKKAENMVHDISATLTQLRENIQQHNRQISEHDVEIASMLARLYTLEEHVGVETPGEIFARDALHFSKEQTNV